MHSAATDQAFNLEAWLHLEALARIRRSGPAVKNTSLEDVNHNPAAADNIQSRDDGQPASPDRHDRPPALPSRDRHNADIQAVAIGGAYGADHYHDDVPGWRWRGGLLVVMAVIALAVLAGTFAYRAVFGGYAFPAPPPIVGTGPNNIVRNNSDTQRSNSSQTSITLPARAKNCS